MKNITVTLDEETYRKARIVAAEQDTSVSALVKRYLSQLSSESEFDRLQRQERELRSQVMGFRSADNFSRDSIHERGS